MSNDLNHNEELQYREQIFSARQFSLELVQKLTYFVVSVELIACGYILLQAANLSEVKNLKYLFLLCGISALLGLLWRFCYNITHYNATHQLSDFIGKLARKLQSPLHDLYAVCSILSLIWFLYLGFNYLSYISIPV